MTDASSDPSPRSGSAPLVASQLLSDLAGLFRAEGSLLRAEFDDRVTQLQAAIAKIAVGIDDLQPSAIVPERTAARVPGSDVSG